MMKLSIKSLCAVACLALSPTLVLAQEAPKLSPFQTAVTLANDGKFTDAVLMFTTLAEHHEGPAQFNLSVMISKGQGTLQNQEDALYWAWRARFSGVTKAADLVKYLIFHTTPEEQENVATRLRFVYGEAFNSGNVEAAMALGRTYNETFATKDSTAAYQWFSIAAALNIKYANAFREAVALDLTQQERSVAQKNAKIILNTWCKNQDTPRPSVCGVMSKLGS